MAFGHRPLPPAITTSRRAVHLLAVNSIELNSFHFQRQIGGFRPALHFMLLPTLWLRHDVLFEDFHQLVPTQLFDVDIFVV